MNKEILFMLEFKWKISLIKNKSIIKWLDIEFHHYEFFDTLNLTL